MSTSTGRTPRRTLNSDVKFTSYLPTPESFPGVGLEEAFHNKAKPSPSFNGSSKRTHYENDNTNTSRSSSSLVADDVSEVNDFGISCGACTSNSLSSDFASACIDTIVDHLHLDPEAQAIADALSAHAELDLTGKVYQENDRPDSVGGYCDVFRGFSLAHATIVAIKRFRVHIYRDKSFAKSLARELDIWSRLHHPNVIPLLGYTIDNNVYPALVSPWMINGTIVQYLTKNPKSCTLSMVKGIAEGLRYLHSMGVSHSDLKSDNVLVSSLGVPLLADFGISRMVLESLSIESKSSLRGSVRWMAPELFDQSLIPGLKNQTPRTRQLLKECADIWAFGMTVYELLTLKRPYYHIQNDIQVMFAVVKGRLPNVPDKIRTATPDERALWEVCNRCWTIDPLKRPSIYQVMRLLENTSPNKSSKSGHVNQLPTPASSVFDTSDLDEEADSYSGSIKTRSSKQRTTSWQGQMNIIKRPRDEYMAQYMARQKAISGLSALRPPAKAESCKRSTFGSLLRYRPRTILKSRAAGVVESNIAVFAASDGCGLLSWMGTTRSCVRRRRESQLVEDFRGSDVTKGKGKVKLLGATPSEEDFPTPTLGLGEGSAGLGSSRLKSIANEGETNIFCPGVVFRRVTYSSTSMNSTTSNLGSLSKSENSCILIACSSNIELSFEGGLPSTDTIGELNLEETGRRFYRSLERVKCLAISPDEKRGPDKRRTLRQLFTSVS